MEVNDLVFVSHLKTGAVIGQHPFLLRSRQIVGGQLYIDDAARHVVVAVGEIGMFFSIFSYRLYGAVLLIHQDV